MAPVKTWFAPYVDVTATPTVEFQNAAVDPARQVVLGFVVASPKSPCLPTWGGRYTVGQAATSLDLDRRIVAYQQRDDGVMISFGGQAGVDLASSCSDPAALESAYLEVVEHYDVRAIDLDIEGALVEDAGVIHREATAIAALERQLAEAGHPLTVWLTLPVEPSGLPPRELSIVDTFLRSRAAIAGVDLLAMDFGTAADPSEDMLSAVENALDATSVQLASEYTSRGTDLDPAQMAAKLGVTVMIGANDVPGETFTLADASELTDAARAEGISRLSMWSLNRDQPCGKSKSASPAGVQSSSQPSGSAVLSSSTAGASSDRCSGVAETGLGFTDIFDGLTRRGIPGTATPLPAAVVDDPARNPYPTWQPVEMYQGGYKVVWNGEVYQAKWFSKSSRPGIVVRHPWDTPWLLLGPVLPSDSAPRLPEFPSGTYPAWLPTAVYRAGARVLYQGLPFVAKYYTTGKPPEVEPIDPFTVPWRPLFTIPGEPGASP